MILKLYDSTETVFGNGCICRLAECTFAEVTEEINKIFELEFKYPIYGKYYDEIQEGRFIGCIHSDKKDVQPFKIYKRSAPMNGMVTFYAHHLSYELSNIIMEPRIVSSPADAFTTMVQHSINSNPFTFVCQKGGNEEIVFDVPVSVRSVLLDSKKSLASTYGGEFEFDKWQVIYSAERGVQTDVTIRYGKNLTDIEQSIDVQSLYNAVIPYWSGKIDGVDVLIMPEGNERIVALEDVNQVIPVAKDFSSDFRDPPEVEDLIEKAEEFLTENEPWAPKENIRINFTQLWQTEDYKDVAELQRVNLGDKLSVYYPTLGVSATNVKVVRTEYDVLNERYNRMEVGQLAGNFLDSTQKATDEVEKKLDQTKTVFEVLMDREIARATEMLINPGESHVLFYKGTQVGSDDNFTITGMETGNGTLEDPEGILIMDTSDPMTAQNVLIINKAGIGFSEDGINGPYKRSWTLDGRFTTDFIATWEIMANIIRLYGLMTVHENAAATYDEQGVLQDPIGGYLGYGVGRIDEYTTTRGIMISNENNDNGRTSRRYVIATDAGTRMTAGNQRFYLTDDYVSGQSSGTAVLHTTGDFNLEIGGNINVVKSGTTHVGYSGQSSANYEVQIGRGNLRIVNGLIVNATGWTAQAYQNEIDDMLDLIQDNSDDISDHETRISGNEQGISNLTTALAGKASASDLSSLASRVTALENASSVAVFG